MFGTCTDTLEIEEAPVVVVRLPSAFADKVMKRKWTSIYLPDFNSCVAGRKYTWFCNWNKLEFLRGKLPPPRFSHAASASRKAIDGALLESLLGHVRALAENSNVDWDGETWQSLHNEVCSVQQLVDEVTPTAMAASIRELTGTGGRADSKVHVPNRIPYRAAFVVRALLQSDLLANDSSLKESVRNGLKLVCPKSLSPMLLNLTETSVKVKTSAGCGPHADSQDGKADWRRGNRAPCALDDD